MSEAPLILGVSGLRGIVGESLTPMVATKYAGSFGEWVQERVGSDRNARVLVARDGRFGGEAIHMAVVASLLSTGCRVRSLVVATTPSVGVACDTMEFDAALIVTASHNPQEWNGIKALVRGLSWKSHPFCDSRGTPIAAVADACAPDAAMAEEIIERYRKGRVVWETSTNTGGYEWDDDTNSKHCLAVKHAIGKAFGTPWNDMLAESRLKRVLTDSVNCSGSAIDFEFFNRGPIELVQLHGGTSGIFPHTPEPTKENLSGEGGLCDAVPGLKADVGFAQDPDADRLAIVDEKGSYIGEEYTLVLCAAALMEARKEEGRLQVGPTGGGKPVFLVNLSTSRMIDDVAAHYGAEVVRTPVGEANVVERMKQLKMAGRDVVMGGEGNGGVIWPEVTYVRDSLSAMALTLALMARTGKKVSELVAMVDAMGPGKKGYCILKRKAPLASKADAVPVVEHLTRVYRGEGGAVVDTQDGVRIDWPARGVWAHVRASNTEPIMRVIVEAPTEALATETAKAVEARIAEV